MQMSNHDHLKEHEEHTDHEQMIKNYQLRFWICLAITIPILLLSPMIREWLGLGGWSFPGDTYVLFLLSSFVYFYGGYPFLKGLVDELRKGRPGMMTLVAMAITAAYIYSSAVVFGLKGVVFFWELATLVDIMLLGHWLEMRSVMGASRALEELARLMPSEAHMVMPGGMVHDVPLSSLEVGNLVLVKPGEKIPADGTIIDGESSVDESLLTGESKPVTKTKGDSAIGGSLNGEGSLKIEVKKRGEDSFIAQVIELVRSAQASKSRTQALADRAAMWLTLAAVSVGLITFFIWNWLSAQPLEFAMERAVTVLVIACPHALGLAIPLAIAISTSLAATNGFLIRDRLAFESARNIQAVIFDKTGTLTAGRFGVTDVLLYSGDVPENELILFAASVESHSEHPIARAITSSVTGRTQTALLQVTEFKALPGKGAQGMVKGKLVQVVSPGYLDENNIPVADERTSRLEAQGKTVVYVIIANRLTGAIALADIVRPESKRAITRLKEKGIKCMMVTGDNREVANWVAQEIGLDEYFAPVLPQDKAKKVKEVQSRNLIVAMVGDGINDAPALAQANVGIAIGAGTDVAIETADVVLIKNNPEDVATVIALSQKTYRKMIQNLFWATGYNVVAIPLAAGVLYSLGIVLTPAVGAVLMSVSTIIVAINARLLRLV